MENYKIRTISQVARIAATAKKQGKTIIITNGCFDILHGGHVQTFQFAKCQGVRHGGLLIVGLNSDASVRRLKGEKRPIVSQGDRAHVIAALESVDYVFIFDGSPLDWIKKIKPDVWVKSKGLEVSPAFIPEKTEVEKYGGRVVFAPQIAGRSTSDLIRKIKAL